MTVENLTFPIKLFVYGTLKRGYSNHSLVKDCKLIKTVNAFGILLHLGGFPGFLPVTTGTSVEGELYEIPDQDTLAALDALEGHPNHYMRQKINLVGGEEVWTYVYNRFYGVEGSSLRTRWDMIQSGCWTGPRSYCTRFLGFFEDKYPPKTDDFAVAHLRIPGEFAGLVDCFTGSILRDNFSSQGKPHLVYDLQEKVWKPANVKGGLELRVEIPTIPKPDTKAITPPELDVPYIDPADPGEMDLPLKNKEAA